MQRSARPTDRPRLGMSPIRSRILPRRARRKATHGSRCRVPQICTHVVDAAIYTLHYDVVKDFEPIALLAKNPVLFLAKNAVPANDLTGLIAWLKVSPDKALFGTASVGSPPHIAGVLFQQIAGTRFQFVHYRGGAPMLQDLVAGHIDIDADAPVTALPHVRAGSIKAFAVTARSRRPTSRQWTKQDCLGSTSPLGSHFLHRRARRSRSSTS